MPHISSALERRGGPETEDVALKALGREEGSPPSRQSSVRKWSRRTLLAATVLVMIGGVFFRAEVSRLYFVLTVFDEHKIVSNFSSMGDVFPAVALPRGAGPVSALPRGPEIFLKAEIGSWLKERNATSLIVLHDGAIVFEDYFLDTGPNDHRISWSIAKSWLSVLFGIIQAEGSIGSLDDPVTRYAPELLGTAYESVSIRDVLTMSSGVAFNEDYSDFWSDGNRMGRLLAIGGSMDAFAASFSKRDRNPGEEWKYVSLDTHVLSMVIRGATGRSLEDLMQEKLVAPLGLQADGFFLTDSHGTAFALGGLNFTSRDYARFAAMVLADGFWNGRQIVPADWLTEATRPQARTKPGAKRYGYQWWIPSDGQEGEFQAEGIYGQYIYFNRPLDVAIIMTAADPHYAAPGVDARNTRIFRRIAQLAATN
jgi:CubicO group peptidase (beta-lactamase class C family)